MQAVYEAEEVQFVSEIDRECIAYLTIMVVACGLVWPVHSRDREEKTETGTMPCNNAGGHKSPPMGTTPFSPKIEKRMGRERYGSR